MPGLGGEDVEPGVPQQQGCGYRDQHLRNWPAAEQRDHACRQDDGENEVITGPRQPLVGGELGLRQGVEQPGGPGDEHDDKPETGRWQPPRRRQTWLLGVPARCPLPPPGHAPGKRTVRQGRVIPGRGTMRRWRIRKPCSLQRRPASATALAKRRATHPNKAASGSSAKAASPIAATVALRPWPTELSTSSHASQHSRVAVIAASTSARAERRQSASPVPASSAARATSKPPQASRQCVTRCSGGAEANTPAMPGTSARLSTANK